MRFTIGPMMSRKGGKVIRFQGDTGEPFVKSDLTTGFPFQEKKNGQGAFIETVCDQVLTHCHANIASCLGVCSEEMERPC